MLFLLRMLLLGVHVLLASVLGLIVSIFRPFHPENTPLCARLYGVPALRILGLRVQGDVGALLNHQRPAVILANHLSNHDLFVFGPVVPPRTVTLGKQSLKWIPLFGQLYWLAGNVLIDRGRAHKARQAMTRTTHALRDEDVSIWVFPEGTRSHGRGLGPLKKGAFLMAINAQVPLVMVCANNYVRGMRLNRWHSGDVHLRALPPVPTAGLTLDDLPALMARCEALMRDCIAELDQQAGTTAPLPARAHA
jgi:1-acyl-sn-glycerol-3-phosphate acyltransferase